MFLGTEQAPLSAAAAGACASLRMQVALEPDQADTIIQTFASRKLEHTSMIPRTARWLHMSRQIIYLVFMNGNTTIAHGATIRLAELANVTPGNEDTMTLMLGAGGLWYELARQPNRHIQSTYDPTSFASLGTSANGTIRWCHDCTSPSMPCTGSGTEAFALRQNSSWKYP
jgi:hypothetical protein